MRSSLNGGGSDVISRERDQIRAAARHGAIGWKQSGQARISRESAGFNQHGNLGAALTPSKNFQHAADAFGIHINHYQVVSAAARGAHLFGRRKACDFDFTYGQQSSEPGKSFSRIADDEHVRLAGRTSARLRLANAGSWENHCSISKGVGDFAGVWSLESGRRRSVGRSAPFCSCSAPVWVWPVPTSPRTRVLKLFEPTGRRPNLRFP